MDGWMDGCISDVFPSGTKIFFLFPSVVFDLSERLDDSFVVSDQDSLIAQSLPTVKPNSRRVGEAGFLVPSGNLLLRQFVTTPVLFASLVGSSSVVNKYASVLECRKRMIVVGRLPRLQLSLSDVGRSLGRSVRPSVRPSVPSTDEASSQPASQLGVCVGEFTHSL